MADKKVERMGHWRVALMVLKRVEPKVVPRVKLKAEMRAVWMVHS